MLCLLTIIVLLRSAVCINDLQYSVYNILNTPGVPDGYSLQALVLKLSAFNYTNAVSGVNATAPANSILYFGGDSLRNDVWTTPDDGVTMAVLAGTYYDVVTNVSHNTGIPSFPALERATCVAHDKSSPASAHYDRIYRLGGTTAYGPVGSVLDVYYTDNGQHWINQTTVTGANTGFNKSEAVCGVTTNGTILWFSGCSLYNAVSPNECLTQTNDVWRSDNYAASFYLVTSTSAFPARAGAAGGVVQSQYISNILYVIGGYEFNNLTVFGDVWASVNMGQTFTLLSATPPFGGRTSASFAASIYGHLVYGFGEYATNDFLNSLYLSLDGGYTWLLINTQAGAMNLISPRAEAGLIIDASGYILTTGGITADSVKRDRRWYKSVYTVYTAPLWLPQVSSSYQTLLPPYYNDPINSICVGLFRNPLTNTTLCSNNPVANNVFAFQLASWGPFPGKNSMYSFVRNTSFTYVDPILGTQTAPAGTLFVVGGYNGESTGGSYLNDVWISTNNGVTWNFIAGITYNYSGSYQTHPSYPTTFVAKNYQCFTMDLNGKIYALGGQNLPAANPAVTSNGVYSSTDGSNWVTVGVTAPFPARAEHSCFADSRGWIYVLFGCANYTSPTPVANSCSTLADIWRSQDGGVTWSQIIPANPANAPPARAQDMSAIYKNTANAPNIAANGKDLIYVMGGYFGTATSPNQVIRTDLWVSSDLGVTWYQITNSSYNGVGLYGGRSLISADGIIVVAGGGYDTNGLESNTVYSMDGGFTWYVLTLNAQAYWTQRAAFGFTFDSLGRVYVIGGLTALSNDKRDHAVYRGTLPVTAASMSYWAENTGGGRFALPPWQNGVAARCTGLFCYPGQACVCGPATSAVTASGQTVGLFTWNVVNWAQWPTRNELKIVQRTQAFSFIAVNASGQQVPTSVNTNSFIMWGGFPYYSDVWYSPHSYATSGNDQDYAWYLLAGTSGTSVSNYPTTFTSLESQCYTSDTSGRLYALGGENNYHDNAASNVAWASTDGLTWTSNTGGIAPFPGITSMACGTDSNKYVYIWGGCLANTTPNTTCDASSATYKSMDYGVTWSRVTTTSSVWSPREQIISALALSNGNTIRSDILYVVGGIAYPGQSFPTTQGTSTWMADVWASTTGGVTWIQLTASAAFGGRASGSMVVSSQGILVVSGGAYDATNLLADAYVSFDGGYYWAILADHPSLTAPFNPTGWFNRKQFAMWIDTSDYMWVSSGYTSLNGHTRTSDVWKSSLSLSGSTTWVFANNSGVFFPSGYVRPATTTTTVNGSVVTTYCTGLYAISGQTSTCGTAAVVTSSSGGSSQQGASSATTRSSAGTVVTPSSSAAAGGGGGGGGSGLSGGAIAGIVIGVVVGVLICCLLIIFLFTAGYCVRGQKKTTTTTTSTELAEVQHPHSQLDESQQRPEPEEVNSTDVETETA